MFHRQMIILTKAKEVMFYVAFVKLSLSNITQKARLGTHCNENVMARLRGRKIKN